MRSFEFLSEAPVAPTAPKKPTGPVKKVATAEPVADTKAEHPADAKPTPVATAAQQPQQAVQTPQQPAQDAKKSRSKKQSALPEEYADIDQTVHMANKIDALIKAADLPGRAEGGWSRLNQPHIRIKDSIPVEAHKKAVEGAGIQLRKADKLTSTVSGQYAHNTFNFDDGGKIYTIVFAARGAQTGSTGGQISKQQLRPNKLGLTGEGQQYTRTSLAQAAKSVLPSKVKDPQTLEALNQLIDVALKKRSTIDPELNAHIANIAGDISQDFGEVLAPIMMADSDNFIITFPSASNEMLIDAEVNGQPVAVKSLGGSGNSFAAIRDLINQYSQAKQQAGNLEYDEMLDLISEFVSDKGSTNDNVIRTAQKAQLPEATELNKLLGTSPQSFAEMVAATENLYNKIVSEVGEDKAYETYIKMVLPVARAGNWLTKGKNPKAQAMGMPSDWRKYSGESAADSEDEKPAKRTGKTSFDKNFPVYAARQLTYLLGVAFDKEMNAGLRAAKMGKTINDIMANKKAVAVKIDITNDGGLEIIQTPFDSVNWRFQYHAATDAPDRNAPGFAMKFK